MINHQYYMSKALELALQAYPYPNPQVGSVIVKNDSIIAEGFHKEYGGPHAEINAFNSLPPNTSLDDAVLYVSLEPCFHHGKTPPCTDRIIDSGIKTVVVACLDPNPLVGGQGIAKLQDAGITVITGILEKEAQELNETFFKFITTKQPFVLIKSAVTMDGKTATVSGQSKWISSEASRMEVQVLRNKFAAVMTGINTVLEDDPLLTCRLENSRQPIRIILDSHLRIPISSQIVQTAESFPTIIATITSKDSPNAGQLIKHGIEILECRSLNNKIDLIDLMNKLGNKNIDSIMIESGGTLSFSVLESGIADKIRMYLCPKIFGGLGLSFVSGAGVSLVENAFPVEFSTIRMCGSDIVIEAYIKKDNSTCLQES
ncbi:MAG: bifunctional diaminohydroxyphosphoribosylaminopyrimidine deaminase/5-amino-6-(5-phosphoribosylamino)uracil reductase RibD [Brevinemataceae bacterium]